MKAPISPHPSPHWVLLFYYFIVLKLGAKAVGTVRKRCPPMVVEFGISLGETRGRPLTRPLRRPAPGEAYFPGGKEEGPPGARGRAGPGGRGHVARVAVGVSRLTGVGHAPADGGEVLPLPLVHLLLHLVDAGQVQGPQAALARGAAGLVLHLLEAFVQGQVVSY